MKLDLTTLEKIRAEVENMKKPSLTKPARRGVIGTMAINYEYNQALTDLLHYLNTEIVNAKV